MANVEIKKDEGTSLETRLNLQPGQNGTKALVRKYGERLVCVRYRYDQQTGRRYKTVELIEETTPWRPSGSREAHLMQRAAVVTADAVTINITNKTSMTSTSGVTFISLRTSFSSSPSDIISVSLPK